MNFKGKIQEAKRILSDDGYTELLKRSISFFYRSSLRKLLPSVGYNTKAGIPVSKRKPLDFMDPYISRSDESHEYAIISELRKHIQEGDEVVVVGAGTGTTSATAAIHAGESGSVVAYEASDSLVNQAERTISLNNVEDRCEVRQSVVGPAIHLASSADESSLDRVHPRELPDCDLLELDCEGAEKNILEEMEILPRIIIVETHPDFDSDPDTIKEILGGKEYEFVSEVDRGSVPVLTARRQET
jgi:hypothetical protein